MTSLQTLASENLLAYCSLINENYQFPGHLVRIAKILQAVERGELKRVIITIPPRHGKSMLCSTYFPAWYLGRNPEKYLITATYGQELSEDFGRKVRDQVLSEEFAAIFPNCEVDKRTQAVCRMDTKSGGTYFGVGVGGPATGRGAHLLLIDDPVKNREEADSEAMREKLWRWYLAVAMIRLQPKGAIVVIMTRWHEDDLVGRLLTLNKNENWTVINLQALGPGETPLWPEAYDKAALLNIKQSMIDGGREYDWHCLYQQEPIPEEGIIFKPDWMPPGQAKEYAAIMVAVDPAISMKDEADETAVCVGGLAYGNPSTIHEIETLYGHWDFRTQIQMIELVNAKYKPQLIGIEDVAYQRVLIEECQRRGLPVAAIKTVKDKVARAMSVSHLFAQGRVRVNTPKLKQQLLGFRGKDEKNDLADAMIHLIGLIRDYTMERMEKKEDRYKDLTPQQAWFRAAEDEIKKRDHNRFENGFVDEFADSTITGDPEFY